MKKDTKTESELLRRKADELAKKKSSIAVKAGLKLSETEVLKLVHNLEVHQIELELQNEALLLTREQLEIDKYKYVELYDFAPTGYFTISKEGNILELNFAGAKMLGKERSRLRNKRFANYISKDRKPIYNIFLEDVFKSKTEKSCEVKLSSDSSIPKYLYLRGSVKDNSDNCFVTAVDITELKLTEGKLQSQTSLLEAQINSTIEGILVIDENNKRVLINNRFVELFNIPQNVIDDEDDTEMLQYVTGQSINPEQFLLKVKYLYGNVNETSKDEVEFKNGMILERYSAPVLDKGGKNYGRIWTFHDVTNRKRTEESLLSVTKRLKNAQRASKAGTWDWDIINNSFYWSDEFLEIFGLPSEVIHGFDAWKKVLHPDDIEKASQYIKESIENRTDLLNDYRIVSPNGEIRWIRATGNTIYEGGKPSKMSGLCQDITELKHREMELRESEERFRSIAESATDAIITANTKGIILNWNKGAERIFGYTEEEMKGKELTVIMPEKYAGLHKEGIKRVEQGGKHNVIGKTIELTGLRKSGDEFPIELSLADWKSASGKYFTGIIRDITERKNVEKELILSKEKAEESDRLKSAFLANVSHEIRTPMNGILGFSELLREPNLTGEEQEKYLKVIEKSGRRMLNTINDIMSISRIESGHMDTYISAMDINEQVEYIYNFFKQEAKKKGIQINVKNCLTAKEAVINTDGGKFDSILTNLVNNALKFTNGGFIEIGYGKKDNFLELYVKDTGEGIKQKHKEIIFERFRQSSEGLSRGYEGSGLGLSISKAYVEMLGGKIWMESQAGKGSTFYFKVPYLDDGGQMPVDSSKNIHFPESVDPKIKKLKILIAEDDEISEMYIGSIVKKYSKEIITALTGFEAVELCSKNPDIDLIFMDIKMPEMSGDEATRRIRKFNKDVIIIVQTAFALKGDKEKFLEAGCNDYLSKPLNQEMLNEIIEKYFGGTGM